MATSTWSTTTISVRRAGLHLRFQVRLLSRLIRSPRGATFQLLQLPPFVAQQPYLLRLRSHLRPLWTVRDAVRCVQRLALISCQVGVLQTLRWMAGAQLREPPLSAPWMCLKTLPMLLKTPCMLLEQ